MCIWLESWFCVRFLFEKRGLYSFTFPQWISVSIPIRLAKPIVIFEKAKEKNCFIIIWSPVNVNYLAATLPACIPSKWALVRAERMYSEAGSDGSFMYRKIRCENRTGCNTKWKSNEFSVRTYSIIWLWISKTRKLFSSFSMPTVEINAHFVE